VIEAINEIYDFLKQFDSEYITELLEKIISYYDPSLKLVKTYTTDKIKKIINIYNTILNKDYYENDLIDDINLKKFFYTDILITLKYAVYEIRNTDYRNKVYQLTVEEIENEIKKIMPEIKYIIKRLDYLKDDNSVINSDNKLIYNILTNIKEIINLDNDNVNILIYILIKFLNNLRDYYFYDIKDNNYNNNIIKFDLEDYQSVINKYLNDIIKIDKDFDINKLSNIQQFILFLVFINNNETLIKNIENFLNLLNKCLETIKKIISKKEDEKQEENKLKINIDELILMLNSDYLKLSIILSEKIQKEFNRLSDEQYERFRYYGGKIIKNKKVIRKY